MRTIKYTNQVSLVFPSRSANESFARSAAAAFAAQLDPYGTWMAKAPVSLTCAPMVLTPARNG